MLLVILLSGLFSYPLTLLVFKILFCVIIAILSSNSDKLNNTEIYVTKQMWGIGKVVVIIICIVIGLSFISYGMKLYQGYKQWHSSETEPSQYIETDDLVTTFPFLIEDPKFVVLQGYNLIAKQKFDEAVTLLESAKSFCPNKSLYYALGLAYKYSNKTDKAEEQYKFLEYAMPTLIRPKYMLAKLYYETKQTTEWRNKALEIINFKPKIQSRYTEAMIQEIRELYYND